MLKLSGVTKRFGGRTVLNKVSLEVAPGEHVAVLGESGIGKSTLLNVIAGLEPVDAGSIAYDGFEMAALSDDAATRVRRDHFGFVFQAFHLLPHLDAEQNVGSLARRLALTEATISHHLSKLHAADLISLRAEGTTHWYRLNPEALRAINKSLLSPAKLARAPAVANREPSEARVLKSFVVDGRLVKIPESHAKREVVLRWVLDQLDDKRHREREISELLKRFHDDYATLRRELINHRMMKREGGIYWKVKN